MQEWARAPGRSHLPAIAFSFLLIANTKRTQTVYVSLQHWLEPVVHDDPPPPPPLPLRGMMAEAAARAGRAKRAMREKRMVVSVYWRVGRAGRGSRCCWRNTVERTSFYSFFAFHFCPLSFVLVFSTYPWTLQAHNTRIHAVILSFLILNMPREACGWLPWANLL